MSLATSNRDGGRTNEAGHLRGVTKGFAGQVLSGLAVSQRGAGANMSVDVAIGDALVQRSDNTYGHPAWNDAVYNQVIATADGSNPRRDIIVMYVDYGQTPSTGVANNTNGVVKIVSVAGTAAGSPTEPSDATIQSAVGSGNPYVKLARIRVAAGATSITNSVIDDLRTIAQAANAGGWKPLSSAWDSWQYSAWNSTYRTATITVPDSTIFTLGQKVKYWQNTGGWKYGFITSKPSGTTITVFQGNSTSGYTINNERIFLPSYSVEKAPDGFPLDPTVWSLEYLSTTDVSASGAPAAGTWYQVTSHQLNVPIGAWNIGYYGAGAGVGSAAGIRYKSTLSTTTSTETDAALSAYQGVTNSSAAPVNIGTMARDKDIVLAAHTPYYLLMQRTSAGAAMTVLSMQGAVATTRIYAKCSYL